MNEYKYYLLALSNDSNEQHKKLAELLSLAISKELTPRQAQMINMYYIDRRCMRDIATELGINVSTVSRTVKRGRIRLKKSLTYASLNQKK